MPKQSREATRVTLADLTETVTAALLRASQVQKRPRPLGPILIGIVWWPEGLEGGPRFGVGPSPLGPAGPGRK
jgi:hypothetical protein